MYFGASGIDLRLQFGGHKFSCHRIFQGLATIVAQPEDILLATYASTAPGFDRTVPFKALTFLASHHWRGNLTLGTTSAATQQPF
jgi:hypothetical protein